MSPISINSWLVRLALLAQIASAYPEGSFSLPVKRAGTQVSSGYVDDSWYIPIFIGTPPQEFRFLTDSGAAALSVASGLLPADEQPNGPLYRPAKSSTSKKRDGYTWSQTFVSGSQSNGVVYQDVVTIADITINDMDVLAQTSNNHNNSEDTSPSVRTGNLGLNHAQGQPSQPARVPTWLARIMPNLNNPLFTVSYSLATQNGTFEFGKISANKHNSPISYAAVDTTFGAGWTIPISGHQLSSGKFIAASNWFVTVDTGTAGARIPRSVADSYFAQVSGAKFNAARGEYTYPCSAKLPDFTFGIGDGRLSILGSHLSSGSFDGGATCDSKLNVLTGDGPALWGQSFIQEFFVVFDWGNLRVGWATKGLKG